MKRATSLLMTYGALVVPAILFIGGEIEAAPRAAGTTYELQVTGRAGVPVDASAVVLNITSAEARGTGFITAWPCGAVRPTASNLNYGIGAPIANNAIVKIGTGGKVCLFTADNDTELIVDINGWFPAADPYTSTSPARLLDTRPGLTTVDNIASGVGVRRAGGTIELQVTGRSGVAATASAAVLNITSAEAGGTGFLTAWPCGTPRPTASNLNYGIGAPVANNAIVKIGTGGKVCLLTADTDTQLIADVNGWFPAGTNANVDYVSTSPARLLDTRPGLTTVDGVAAGLGLRRTGDTYELQVSGRAGVPANASAVVLNITSAEARGTGFLTAWPCGTQRPTASNLNYGIGAPVANTAIVKVGTGGKVCLFTGDTDTQLIADINGWFPSGSTYSAITPLRLLDTRGAASPPGAAFVATFATAADFYDRFDTDVHFRAGSYNGAATFHGDHNEACAAPTTGRTIHLDGASNDEVFYWCAPGDDPTKGHVMDAMGEAGFGYAIVTFKPKQSFSGVDRVCVDVNATDLGGDNWWEMSVVPKSTFDANGGRMDYVTAVASGIDDTALHFPTAAFVYQINDNKIRAYQGMSERVFDGFRWSTSDRAQRFQYCMVDNHNGTVTMTRQVGVASDEAPGGVRTITVSGSFPAGESVVLIQHSIYDPPKHGSGPTQTTLHWDNITVE